MTKPNRHPQVVDEVPWSDGISEFHNQHDETYIRLLHADKAGVGKDEMARLILGINPAQEPKRAYKLFTDHPRAERLLQIPPLLPDLKIDKA